MAKLSRDSLKEIVKECLVEILSEGIGGTPARTLKVSKSKPKSNSLSGRLSFIRKKNRYFRFSTPSERLQKQ